MTGAAPLAAMMFNIPIAVLGGGSGAPAAFLIATVVLTIFSVGYIEMSRRVTAAGGFYTFITRGLGPVAGLGSGILIALCYIIFSAAVMGVLGYFAATSFNDWFGIDLPAYAYTRVALLVISMFGWFHIELTAKVLGVALVLEVLALTVLAVAVIAKGGDSGLSLAPINPAEVFNNDVAKKAFGASAVGIALFAAFWSWVGFEMAPNYAEESKDPKRIAKAATYGSVIGLGLFYIVISWVFVMAWGSDNVGAGVSGQFEGKYGSAFYPLTDRYVGGGLTTGLEILIITSSFACAMAFYNTSARYLFSLSREKVLPKALGRVHPKTHSPYIASVAVTGPGVPVPARLHDLRLLDRGLLPEARHLDAAARSARDPVRAGDRLVRDHQVLHDDGEGRLPLVEDPDRADHRRPGPGRSLLPADRQPRRARGRGRRLLHQVPALVRGDHVRRWDDLCPVPEVTFQGCL